MVSSFAYLRFFIAENYSLFCHFASLKMYKGHINFWIMPCTFIMSMQKKVKTCTSTLARLNSDLYCSCTHATNLNNYLYLFLCKLKILTMPEKIMSSVTP